MTRPPFPEPREVPCLFDDQEQFSFSVLSTGAVVTTDGTYLYLRFPFDESKIADIRGFACAHWDPEAKQWSVKPIWKQAPQLVRFLREGGFVFGADVADLLRAAW